MAQAEAPSVEATTESQDEQKQEDKQEVTEFTNKVHLNIVKIIKEAQLNHGLKTSDHRVYRKYCCNRLRKLRSDLGLQCSDEVNKQRQKDLLEEIKRNRNLTKAQRKALKKQNKAKKESEKRDPNWNPKYKLKKEKKEVSFKYKKIEVNDIARIHSENEIKLEKELALKEKEKEKENDKTKEKEQESKEKENDKNTVNASSTKKKGQGSKQKSQKKKKDKNSKNNKDKIISESKALEIPLFLAERAWSYSRELYSLYDEDHKRKLHHSNSRLRKAIDWAKELHTLCWNDAICDDYSKLQSLAYLSILQATFDLQKERFQKSVENFIKAKVIYGVLIDTVDSSDSIKKKSTKTKTKSKSKKHNDNDKDTSKKENTNKKNEIGNESEFYQSIIDDINRRLNFLQKNGFESTQDYSTFVETIEKKFLEIISSQVENVKNEFGNAKSKRKSYDDKEGGGTGADGEIKKERRMRVFKEIRENTLEVNGKLIHLHSKYLQKWINQFRKLLNQVISQCLDDSDDNEKRISNKNGKIIYKRQLNVMRLNEMMYRCYKNANNEMKRNETRNKIRYEQFSMVSDFCNLQKLRLEIIKNCLWFENNNLIFNNNNNRNNNDDKASTNKKQNNNKERKNRDNFVYSDSKRLKIYQLAKLCERQIELIDKFINDESLLFKNFINNIQLQAEMNILKEYFNTFKCYYISQIYLFNNEMASCYSVITELLDSKLNDFQQMFKIENAKLGLQSQNILSKWGDYDSCFYISCLANMNNLDENMNELMKICDKCSLLAKAKYILSNENQSQTRNQGASSHYFMERINRYNGHLSDEEVSNLVSMKRNILPLLPKPVLYDLAWNYIEYPNVNGENESETTKKKQNQDNQRHHQHSKEQHTNKKEKDNKGGGGGGGWFGSLFGGN